MQKHVEVFGYVMLVYAFGFIAAITFDTERAFSGRLGITRSEVQAIGTDTAERAVLKQTKDAQVSAPAAAVHKKI